MKKIILYLFLTVSIFGQNKPNETKANPPIYIAFLWHMHQPIYWPYESIIQTNSNNRYPYSVFDIHNSRTGPYTSWPKNAVEKGIAKNLTHFGAQVSFSGSLIENLNYLEASGNGNFLNWKSNWNNIKTKSTSLGNPRMDMVGFGYHHPLMGLIDYTDVRKQIQEHKNILRANFSGNYSKGIFPPENAFTNRMIQALVDEGLEWVLVDNIHFDRTCEGYPFSTSGNLYEQNPADILNPNPNDWVQLQDLWAPTKISAKWGHQPHFVEYVNPETGQKSKIIAVPTERYMGNEDGRGGFGALQYESVMSQLESYNNDENHPILIVLHHDGDNYGGGTDSYYGSNFQAFVDWIVSKSDRFVCTTIQDYLELFPPADDDVIHIENGSWSGADNGDPEFKKWIGDPNSENYSPDRNSWGVVTAAKNYVQTAEDNSPNSANTENAWKYFLNSEASDYWYWDFSIDGIWDAHPTRATNLAIPFAQNAIEGTNDLTPPTIFQPQREPYNPGGTEWGITQKSDLTIWTYVYDLSGLESVKLKYRIDLDGSNSLSTTDNEKYSGGTDVESWMELPMNVNSITPETNIQPLFKADEYSSVITGLKEKLIDYYIEAIDKKGNIAKSSISHVFIGENNGGGTGSVNLTWIPENPTRDDEIEISITNVSGGAKLHWGVNNVGSNWVTPNQVYWTAGSAIYGSGPAVESPFSEPDTNNTIKIKMGPFNNEAQLINSLAFVIHYNDNTWDNNNGQDYKIVFGDSTNEGGESKNWIMDGKRDSSAKLLTSNNEMNLYVDWDSSSLYISTESAPNQNGDIFIFVADSASTTNNSPWGKSGKVATWDAFIANESTNNYASWNDQNGSTELKAGADIEGKINLIEEFGKFPAKIYLAVGKYNTNDNGILLSQLPIGNSDANIDFSEFYEFDFVITSIKENVTSIPSEYVLSQNFPNPFNPSTIINFSLPKAGKVKLIVYNTLGQQVAELLNSEMEIGNHSVEFNTKNLSSGVYIYKIISGNFVAAKKMILAK